MIYSTPFFNNFKQTILDLDTKKAQLFKETLHLSNKFPEIEEQIQVELDNHALQQKQNRLANKVHAIENQPDLIDKSKLDGDSAPLQLNSGRPRAIPNGMLLFLLVLRGCHGSVTTQEVLELVNDSKTIELIKEYYGCKSLKANTMRENLNIISPQVGPLIFKCQIQLILDELLDDFSEVLIDSTAVSGNTAYPTDITVMNKLLVRISKCLNKLELFAIEGFKSGPIEELLQEISSLVTSISLSFGNNNKNIKKKRRKNLKRLFKKSRELMEYFLKQQLNLQINWEEVNLAPSKTFALDKLWGKIEQDLEDAAYTIHYAESFLLKGKKIKNGDKFLSISDPDVGYIQKGNRVPVIGYKPQLALSGNGFISGYITPEGNASDTSMFIPVLKQVIENTSRVPSLVSVDDGYSSEDNLKDSLCLGVATVSFSGSKGKRLTEDFWDTTECKYARNKRSAVESLMFTMKFSHEFGQLSRRGLNNVHAEQLEKVIAYNFMHIIRTREKISAFDIAS